jgi:predicted DCC family thiol-disulfide oxidoreductase YuxK
VKPPYKLAHPPTKPLVLFDGDCGFCRRWIAVWRGWTGDAVDYAASQESDPATRFPEIPPTEFDNSIQLLQPDGTVYSGAEAVFRALATVPGFRWPLWIYDHVRGADWISEKLYAFVAAHRMPFSVLTRWVLPPEPLNFVFVRSLFLRGLGIVYLCAFLSLWLQVPGLLGQKGILPVDDLMQAAHAQLGGLEKFHRVPTFCWISGSDLSLQIQCGLGALFSITLIAGLIPCLSTIALWLLYLSLVTVGRDFLSFQWDALLLETGLISIFVAPLSFRLSKGEPPSLVAIWLQRWLLFRLMFHSGVVKLTSGDPTWHNLTALDFHYETQPLPTWLAYSAHYSPQWLHHTSVVLMFVIEIGFAFLVLGPRWLRIWAFWPMVLLQLAIALTGNYCFFNLLTVLLCLWLLDDQRFKRFRHKLSSAHQKATHPPKLKRLAFRIRGWSLAVVTIVILIGTFIHLALLASRRPLVPKPFIAIYSWVEPFRSINSYGLFAVMTTTRPEIIIEGSNDRNAWLPYQFKYKPGDLKERPRFVAPHQPRLDWQMWFAALGDYRQNPWFNNLLFRLSHNEPAVIALLQTNPFPEKPPKYLRASLYDYHFSKPDVKARTGEWWRREPKGLYFPEVEVQKK